MNTNVTIQQLHASAPDTYINGAVEGWLVQIRPPNGKVPAKAKLQEGPATIDVTLWGGDPSHWEGKRVRFSGKGMKVSEYKGTKQLSVGDKVEISSAGVAEEPEPMPGDPPFGYTPRNPPYNPPLPQGGTGATQPPQNRPALQLDPPPRYGAQARISEMASLYVECLKGARHVVSLAFTEATPEDTRNIATALFIQATREGLKAQGEPF